MRKVFVVGMFILVAATGCSSAPVYKVSEGIMLPSTGKFALVEQTKCTARCTDPSNPKTFTETLKSRLENRLEKPIALAPAITKMDQYGYYTPNEIAEVGRVVGADYVIDAQLSTYTDPSSSSRAGAVAITALTAVLPVRVAAYTTSGVTAYVSVVRVSDGKMIGQWRPDMKGGTFSKCTSLSEDIADMIYEKQFIR